MVDFQRVAKSMLMNNLKIPNLESVLVVADASTESLGRGMNVAFKALGIRSDIVVFPDRAKSGEEPPSEVVRECRNFQVLLCMTKHSLTHTLARKNLVAEGHLFVTMPGVTEKILEGGALNADYSRVEAETVEVASRMTDADAVTLNTGNGTCSLRIPIRGVQGIPSVGVFRNLGEGGNIPSGEAYLAPVEGKTNGQLYVDGSISGIGIVEEPTILTINDGRLVEATGPVGQMLLRMLGDGLGRNVAELGIGTNYSAKLIGEILEDEKAFDTAHVAFGSNHTFGGTVNAGVHIDCIVKSPKIFFE